MYDYCILKRTISLQRTAWPPLKCPPLYNANFLVLVMIITGVSLICTGKFMLVIIGNDHHWCKLHLPAGASTIITGVSYICLQALVLVMIITGINYIVNALYI